MIPFFRRIRKKLADDNKPIKYLSYAIGEIVLVVIGILIAIQINNWNEANKRREKELHYLTNIKTDLYLNIKQIDSYITKRNEQIESASYGKQKIMQRSIIKHTHNQPFNQFTLQYHFA